MKRIFIPIILFLFLSCSSQGDEIRFCTIAGIETPLILDLKYASLRNQDVFSGLDKCSKLDEICIQEGKFSDKNVELLVAGNSLSAEFLDHNMILSLRKKERNNFLFLTAKAQNSAKTINYVSCDGIELH